MKEEFNKNRQQLIREASEQNPHFSKARRLIFILLSVLVTTRVIHCLSQIAFYISYGLPVTPSDIFIMVASISVAVIFAGVIYLGVRPLCFLALFGGLYSFFKYYMDGNFTYMFEGYIFYDIMCMIFTLVVFTQIFIMTFLITSTKCRQYFTIQSNIQREMSSYLKTKP